MGRWTLDCSLADGARIGRLQFDGIDLLTRAPAAFRPPAGDYGDYELRPVYGYDDCFPTVDRTFPSRSTAGASLHLATSPVARPSIRQPNMTTQELRPTTI
jgi:hypothetical protein